MYGNIQLDLICWTMKHKMNLKSRFSFLEQCPVDIILNKLIVVLLVKTLGHSGYFG